jgi:hypothetical protein
VVNERTQITASHRSRAAVICLLTELRDVAAGRRLSDHSLTARP